VAFRFRLAPLLRHRARTEDLLALALARAIERREGAARRLAVLRAEAEAGRAALAHSLRQGTGGMELRALGTAIQVLARRVRWGEEMLAAADDAVQAARAVLARATRDRRALERLEAIAREGYARDRARAEARALDEVALSPYQARSNP
jgi:flagellar export protein FliJ